MSDRFRRPGAAACAFLLILLNACAGGRALPVHQPMTIPANGVADEMAFVRVSEEDKAGVVVPGEPAEGPARSAYRLDVEDVLDISVYGEPDLQHIEVAVRPDGMISFAFVGDVPAAGRTVEEIRADMTQQLTKYLRSPQVTIIAKQFAQKKIYIGGEVRTPGIVYLTGREGTLLDALYKAGLVTERASLERAYVMRGNQIISTDFKDLVRGNHARNIRLMNQDTVYVPEDNGRYIYVLGQVGTNMALETREPIPIIQAIARAGGFERFAARGQVIVVRGGLKDPSIATVDTRRIIEGDLTQNITVRPGDIIYVGLSARGKFNEVLQQILLTIAPVVQGTILSNTVNP
jgi:polysaccharide export outer membrane protein